MINILNKDNHLYIEGHTKSDICSSVSTLTYTCYNLLNEYEPTSFEFTDYTLSDVSQDKIEILLIKHDAVTDLIWDVICRSYEELSIQFPECVTYKKEETL